MARKSSRRALRYKWKPVRIMHGHRLLLMCIAAGAALFAALTLGTIWQPSTRFLLSWDVSIALYLALIFGKISAFDIKSVQTHAAEQDEGAIMMLVVVACASLASLAAVVAFLGGAKQDANLKGIYFLFAVATIILSWCVIHTMFSLHYVHEYYGDGRDRRKGGLVFPGESRPDHWDFIYFSFVIGMTFQVSDVQVTSKALRHIVVLHGIVSFTFSVAILALAVNIGSNLI